MIYNLAWFLLIDWIRILYIINFFITYPHINPWEFVTGLSGVFHFAMDIYHINVKDCLGLI